MKKFSLLFLIFSLTSCYQIVEKTKTRESFSNINQNNKPKVIYFQRAVTASFIRGKLQVNRTQEQVAKFSDDLLNFEEYLKNQQFAEVIKGKKLTAQAIFLQKNRIPGNAIIEISDAKFGKRRSITYNAKVLSGKMPKVMAEISLLIED